MSVSLLAHPGVALYLITLTSHDGHTETIDAELNYEQAEKVAAVLCDHKEEERISSYDVGRVHPTKNEDFNSVLSQIDDIVEDFE